MIETTQSVQPVPELTAVAIDYAASTQGFVADSIVVKTEVKRDSFIYEKWGREDLKNIDRQERAIGAPANESSNKLSVTYPQAAVKRYAIKDDVADEILNNSVNRDRAKNKRVQKIVREVKLGSELRVKALIDGTANTGTPSALLWDDPACITIEADVDGVKEAMNNIIGVVPTHMIIPFRVANSVRRNGTIRELIKYNPNDLLKSGQLPAPLFGMNVIIPGGLQDSARPGATASIGGIWDDKIVRFIYMDPEGGDGTMTALMEFFSSQEGAPYGTMEWRDPDPSTKKTWFATEVAHVQLNTTPEGLYTLTGVIN